MLNLLGTGIAKPEIYPVPFTNEITIEHSLESKMDCEISILDLEGKLFSKKTFVGVEGNNKFIVKTEQLPAGVYFIEVKVGAETFTQKIVK
jgi:hypothetical protein